MLATLVQKELRAILLSPKFTGAFAVCSLLILLSVYTGIQEYQAAVDQYDTASRLNEETLRQATSWGHLGTKAYRKPDPMQIFSSGLSYDIGRWSYINEDDVVELRHSAYSDDPIFAVFRFVDFAFIVQFVLSLLAILFTYDAVCGERESGTLRLVFSNAVSRAQYLVAKCLGAWLGLVIPICIPILLALLLVLAFGVDLSATHWFKLLTLIGLSLLLFTFFIVMGVFVSTLTRRSSVSFLATLVLWIVFVMIIPRAGVMAAGDLVDVPRVAQIDGQRAAFARSKWDEFYKQMTDNLREFEQLDDEDQEARDALTWAMMERQDSTRKVIEKEIEEYNVRLHEDLRQRKATQEKLAFTLAKVSPASSYQLAVQALAETDIDGKRRYEDVLENYRKEFSQYVQQKVEETGDAGTFTIDVRHTADGSGDVNIASSRSSSALDVSGVPRFTPPHVAYAEIMGPVVIDFGLLGLSILVAFVGAFVAFLRYDVR